jgi:zinc protease
MHPASGLSHPGEEATLKRVPLFLALIGLLLAGPAAADENPMPRVFPYETHVETLENGLKVVLVPMSAGGLVAYWTIVRTGARDEYEPGRTGFAHFFEHMMFRGTERHPQEVYNRMVTEMGAGANAFTTDDLTAYHLKIAAEDLERVMDLESDRFRSLAYAEREFRTEAGAVHGEYLKTRMNPFFAIHEAVQKTAFDVHTYGHTAMGFEEDIKRMPEMYDYSQSFFSRYYRPENVVLVIAGEVDAAHTMELVRKYYGGWQPGYVPPKVQPEPEQKAERRVEVSYPGRTLPILTLAYKADRFDPSNRLYVASHLLADLAFGETSELYRKLALEEQLVEFLAASVGENRDPGLFSITTRVKDPARVDEVREQIETAIARYQTDLPDPQRLADLKSRLRYGFLMRLETPSNVASDLARPIAVTGGVEALDAWYAALDSVSPEEVLAAARTYLRNERRTVAVLRGQN